MMHNIYLRVESKKTKAVALEEGESENDDGIENYTLDSLFESIEGSGETKPKKLIKQKVATKKPSKAISNKENVKDDDDDVICIVDDDDDIKTQNELTSGLSNLNLNAAEDTSLPFSLRMKKLYNNKASIFD